MYCFYARQQQTLMKEALIMAELKHDHVIEMIGLCKSDNMLILEYASLGPLNTYLKNNRYCACRLLHFIDYVPRFGCVARISV